MFLQKDDTVVSIKMVQQRAGMLHPSVTVLKNKWGVEAEEKKIA